MPARFSAHLCFYQGQLHKHLFYIVINSIVCSTVCFCTAALQQCKEKLVFYFRQVILGVDEGNLRRLQEESGANMMLMGRGSMEDPNLLLNSSVWSSSCSNEMCWMFLNIMCVCVNAGGGAEGAGRSWTQTPPSEDALAGGGVRSAPSGVFNVQGVPETATLPLLKCERRSSSLQIFSIKPGHNLKMAWR